jgi:integrase
VPSSQLVAENSSAFAPCAKLEVLTTEQVLGLADAVPPRYSALIVSGAGLGLRPGELFGLTVDRVDFLRRTVTSTASSSTRRARACSWRR